MEGYGHRKNRLTVLNRHHASGGEAASIPDPVDFVDDRHLGIASEQKISMKGMRRSVRKPVNRAAGGNQRLANHLAAKNALPADLRRTASKQIDLDRLEIKDGQQLLHGRGHRSSRDTRTRYDNVDRSKVVPPRQSRLR